MSFVWKIFFLISQPQQRLITASQVSIWDRDSLSINHLSSPDQKADLISKARKPLSLSPSLAAPLFSVLKHHLPESCLFSNPSLPLKAETTIILFILRPLSLSLMFNIAVLMMKDVCALLLISFTIAITCFN